MIEINVKKFNALPLSKQIEYTTVLQHLNAKEIYKIKLENLSYFDVRTITKEMTKDAPNVELIFTKSLGITQDEFFSLPIQYFFQIKKYIEKFFVSLTESENNLLNEVSADAGLWELAGGKDLNVFSDILPLSQLAKVYGGYPYEYGEKSYLEILFLLRMNNKQGKVESEYQKLLNKK